MILEELQALYRDIRSYEALWKNDRFGKHDKYKADVPIFKAECEKPENASILASLQDKWPYDCYNPYVTIGGAVDPSVWADLDVEDYYVIRSQHGLLTTRDSWSVHFGNQLAFACRYFMTKRKVQELIAAQHYQSHEICIAEPASKHGLDVSKLYFAVQEALYDADIIISGNKVYLHQMKDYEWQPTKAVFLAPPVTGKPEDMEFYNAFVKALLLEVKYEHEFRELPTNGGKR